MALDSDRPLFVISVAAELAGMHPQTLRQYDRLGLVQPQRAPGRARRYSERDVQKLQEIQELSQSGVSLEGIKRIMQLENQVEALQARMVELQAENEALRNRLQEGSRVFAAGTSGGAVHLARGKRPAARPKSQAVVLYRPR
ncbi:heat shock protein transcriptional repressor HspR [Rothia nasimurium]|uniref:heat shock protein transcriptional repressor HspR n=1 Tax=Rothia nasimurium TaxID=85336 RepID=UPI001F46BB65|nr:helix-turn-helix transcriptional regulator [Rothia nasimurium]